MIRIPPPHRGHTRGSTSYTCSIRCAEVRVAADPETWGWWLTSWIPDARLPVRS